MHDVDLIVVGAGSGGAVLAARCSAEMDVLLLEAGPAPDLVPAEVSGPNFHRAYALAGRVWSEGYASGRGVGGSSAVNAMVASDTVDGGSVLPIECHPASPDERGPVSEALLRVGRREGVEVGPLSLTRTAGGERCSVVEAYLRPAIGGGRLALLGDALVDRVLVEHGVASGVRLADGRTFSARCVVLAAGAVRTPGVLVRSGVASPAVGRGLQEHPTVTLPLVLRAPLGADDLGRLVSVSVGGTAAWRVPGDVQVVAADAIDERRAALLVSLMRVESRGSVRVASFDPHAAPEVDLGLLTDARDAEAMQFAVALGERLVATPELAAVAEWNGERVPGGAFHAAGTCRMGRPGDPDAVVDHEGRVYGVEGLWVCDASVFPRVPMVNPHLPVVRFAEHAASAMCRAMKPR